MASTIEFLRQVNRASIGLHSDWLSRLQLVAENDVVSGLAEVVVIDTSNGGTSFDERLESPAIVVPNSSQPRQSFNIVNEFLVTEISDHDFSVSQVPSCDMPVDDIPDTSVVPTASPPPPGRSDENSPKPLQPNQDKPVQDVDIVDLQDFEDVNLRMDQAHQPSASRLHRPEPKGTRKNVNNSRSPEGRLPIKCSEVKQIVDRILKQYPPVASAILMFVPSTTNSSSRDDKHYANHRATVRAIAAELAGRTNEEILTIDATENENDVVGKGLAEVINRSEPIQNVIQATDISNLMFMHSGEGDLTVRKTRPSTLVKMAADLRDSYQYVCIAAPSVSEVITKTLSRYSEVCYLIVDLQTTDQTDARNRVDILRRAGARIGGCIIRQHVDIVV